MTATKDDAVEAVGRFLADRRQAPLDLTSVHVDRDRMGERDAWVVQAPDPLPPGDAEWMYADRRPVRCFVDEATGELLGFEVGTACTML